MKLHKSPQKVHDFSSHNAIGAGLCQLIKYIIGRQLQKSWTCIWDYCYKFIIATNEKYMKLLQK